MLQSFKPIHYSLLIIILFKHVDGGVVLQHNGIIPAWGRGSRYQDASGVGVYTTGALPAISKSANLLDSTGRFFRRTRPQYETLSAAYFDSVKSMLTIKSYDRDA